MPVQSNGFIFLVHFPIMIVELIISIMFFALSFIILNKWRERRTVATLYLSLALFALSAAIFIAFTGLASWYFTWVLALYSYVPSTIYYRMSLPLGYTLVIVYDAFLFLFTIQIFLGGRQKLAIPVLIIGVLLIMLLFLPNNYYGVERLPTDPPSIRTIVQGLYLLYNVAIFGILGLKSYKASRDAGEKVSRVGFQTIAMSQVINISIFVFFLMDAIVILLIPFSPGYSFFIYLAWIFAFIAGFFVYLGYILPPWFRKLISKES
ncbi:MAG: hypothetical protein ACTSRW_01040 [Candidatus Helarchaeota archaeon]